MTELDLRQQRTRGALQAALIALVTEMPFESLTVADVTRRARVARKTFYAHYPDKDALLLDCVAPVLEAVAASVSHTDVETLLAETLLADNKPLSYPVFKLVGERAGFYSALLNEQGSARLIVFVLDFLTRHSYERHERLWRSAPRLEVEPLLIASRSSLRTSWRGPSSTLCAGGCARHASLRPRSWPTPSRGWLHPERLALWAMTRLRLAAPPRGGRCAGP